MYVYCTCMVCTTKVLLFLPSQLIIIIGIKNGIIVELIKLQACCPHFLASFQLLITVNCQTLFYIVILRLGFTQGWGAGAYLAG